MELKSLVSREREVTTEILHYLREVESRKLHLERGYPSLFEFTVRELGYSEGSAHRRLSAMRLVKALPELEPKIRSGELTLTNAARAQGFFKEEAKLRNVTREEKKTTVESLLNQSTRECERTLAAISPASALPKEKERAITEELTQIQFLADRELLKKLERLKGLLAHQNFEGSYAVLFNKLADLALKKLDPLRTQAAKNLIKPAGPGHVLVPETASKTSKADLQKSNSTLIPEATPLRNPGSAQNETEQRDMSVNEIRTSPLISPRMKSQAPRSSSAQNFEPNSKPSRFIPIAIRRAVLMWDEERCTYLDRKTNRRCNSQHALDFDHRVPLVMGGKTTVENLRLLCNPHHQLLTERISWLV